MRKVRMVCSVNGEVKEWLRIEAFRRSISVSVLVEKAVRKMKKENDRKRMKEKKDRLSL